MLPSPLFAYLVLGCTETPESTGRPGTVPPWLPSRTGRSPGDVEIAIRVIEQYRDLGIGLADASVVVLAARYDTNRILTLDERHFRALRPLRRGRSFRLLPQDT